MPRALAIEPRARGPRTHAQASAAVAVRPKIHVGPDGDVERKIGDWLVCYLEERDPSEFGASLGERLQAGASIKMEGRARRRPGTLDRGGKVARRWARIEVRRVQSVVVVRLLDSLLIKENVIEELAEELDDLLRAGNRRVVLDFARIERMSSQIVGVVVDAYRACVAEAGGMLKVCGLRPRVADLFDLAGVLPSIPVHPDEATALATAWPDRPGPRPLPLSILAALVDPAPRLHIYDGEEAHFEDADDDASGSDEPRDRERPGRFVWLVVEWAPESGPSRGSLIPVRGDCFLIGQGEECHLRVDAPLMAKRHAAIERRGDYTLISDLGSECGTTINGQPLARSSAVLTHGAQVRFGPLACLVAIGDGPETPPALDDLAAGWVGDGPGTPPALDDLAAGWVGEGTPQPRAAAAEEPAVPEWQEALPGHRVAFEMIEEVLVITPRLNRLDLEAETEKLREGLAEIFELGLSDRVVLKLNHITHISSHGLGVLLAFFLRLSRAGGTLRLCEIHSRVLSVLEQFRLPILLEIRNTVEDAVLGEWE